MINYYRIILLLIALVFLTTFNPNKLNFFSKDKNSFFSVKNIQIQNITLKKIVKKRKGATFLEVTIPILL